MFLDLLGSVIPKAGDSAMEIVRKCVFMVALLVLIGSVSYLLNDMVIQPGIYENTPPTKAAFPARRKRRFIDSLRTEASDRAS